MIPNSNPISRNEYKTKIRKSNTNKPRKYQKWIPKEARNHQKQLPTSITFVARGSWFVRPAGVYPHGCGRHPPWQPPPVTAFAWLIQLQGAESAISVTWLGGGDGKRNRLLRLKVAHFYVQRCMFVLGRPLLLVNRKVAYQNQKGTKSEPKGNQNASKNLDWKKASAQGC